MKMTAKKPVVVFVFTKNRGQTSTRFSGFATRLKKAGHFKDVDIKTVALEDLVFTIDAHQEALVTNLNGNAIFDDASLVYFKSWEGSIETASTVATYLASRGIPFIDEVVADMGVSKLSQLFKLWSQNVNVTPLIYSTQPIPQKTLSKLNGKHGYIVKPIHGQKGKGVQLVATIKGIAPNSLVQPYIENEGDYRVLVYGFKVRGALYRKAADGMVVNNTSAGASSNYLSASEVPKDVAELAVKAAKATNHSIAGVDVIVNKNTGEAYVLEVNQGSQIVTGQWTDKKMAAFSKAIENIIQKRYTSKEKGRLSVIGRHAVVDLPELGVRGITGKIDTGAYSSSLHVENINENKGILSFSVPVFKNGKIVGLNPVSVTEYGIVKVTSSTGKSEQRYSINTLVKLNGREYHTPVTLTHRGGMKNPMLLGRRLLRGRFLVNPELSRKAYEEDL